MLSKEERERQEERLTMWLQELIDQFFSDGQLTVKVALVEGADQGESDIIQVQGVEYFVPAGWTGDRGSVW